MSEADKGPGAAPGSHPASILEKEHYSHISGWQEQEWYPTHATPALRG